MGYLVSISLVEGLERVDDLQALHKSLPWRAFSLPDSDLTLIEWLHRPNPNNPPPNTIKFPRNPEFARRPSGASFPDKFGDEIPGLDALYESLLKEKRASSFPKVGVHLAFLISDLTGCRVTTIMSDDDSWDFSCAAHHGKLINLEFNAWERAEGDFEIVAMKGEGEFVRVGHQTESLVLHQIAERTGTALDERLGGLFGFDGDPTVLGLIEIGRALSPEHVEAPTVEPAGDKKPFWKFW